jgi:hypothetical protein
MVSIAPVFLQLNDLWVRVLQRNRTNRIEWKNIYNRKKSFRLLCMIRGWIDPQCMSSGELGRPVAAQFKNLKASEQEVSIVQPHSEGEGVEAPWSFTGASPSWNIEDSGVMSTDNGSSRKCTLSRKIEHVGASTFHFFVLSRPKTTGQFHSHSGFIFHNQFNSLYMNCFYKHSHRHTKKYALPTFSASHNPVMLTFKINHYKGKKCI